MARYVEAYDVVVCGGGLAGLTAAVAAARHGARTCLVQDRPVLGGNSSSEIRVPPQGAAGFHSYARETGIISELTIEDRFRNHDPVQDNGGVNSVWDMVLYDLAMTTANLTVKLNTSVFGVLMEGDEAAVLESAEPQDRGFWHRPACNRSRRIAAVLARTGGAEVQVELRASVFIDCTGDSLIAHLSGCEWRMGSEGRDEFGEPHAPSRASKDTMGNSIHFRTRDVGRPTPYTPPAWAMIHDDPDYFYKQGRVPGDLRGGFWWIEIGVPWNTITDAEAIRHELTRRCLGIWDWMKNRDPKTRDRATNLALDWIGQVPGKRESRRVMGHYLMTEHDAACGIRFEDEIAYGGYFIDLHTPGGLLASSSEPAAAENYNTKSEYAARTYCSPYGIPLRCLISKDIDNLLLAGRNISVTHTALGTVRVMGTTALMGQAAGTAAAMAATLGLAPISLSDGKQICQLQQQLLRDGVFLPNVRNQDSADLARQATVSASSEAVLHGIGPADEVLPSAPAGASQAACESLADRMGQYIAISDGRVDSIAVCLRNSTGQEQQVTATLVCVEHIWDYRVSPEKPLVQGVLTVPPGEMVWVQWDLNLKDIKGPGYVRLDLQSEAEVQWHRSQRILPGMVGAFAMNDRQMRRLHKGVTLCFRIAPAQRCWNPGQVLSGVTRPHRFTNLWRSDPSQPLPQWLQLAWEQPQEIRQVQLVFAGNLLAEYHSYPGQYRDAQTISSYTLQAFVQGRWTDLVKVEGNYQRLRRHDLSTPVVTDRIRVMVHETNGDPAANLYEVRIY